MGDWVHWKKDRTTILSLKVFLFCFHPVAAAVRMYLLQPVWTCGFPKVISTRSPNDALNVFPSQALCWNANFPSSSVVPRGVSPPAFHWIPLCCHLCCASGKHELESPLTLSCTSWESSPHAAQHCLFWEHWQCLHTGLSEIFFFLGFLVMCPLPQVLKTVLSTSTVHLCRLWESSWLKQWWSCEIQRSLLGRAGEKGRICSVVEALLMFESFSGDWITSEMTMPRD